MNISLKGIPVGDWRELTELELEDIFKLIKKSSPNDGVQTNHKPTTPKRNSIHRERKSPGAFQNKPSKRVNKVKGGGAASSKVKPKGSRDKNRSNDRNSAWLPKHQTSKRGSKRYK